RCRSPAGSAGGAAMALPPSISVTLRPDGRHVVEGPHRLRMGHVIERPDGERDGIYAEWSWDGQAVHIRGDRYGFRPLFYFCDATRFVASPSLAVVAKVADLHEPDVEAISVF